jgi:hypothetical protein
MDIGEIEARLPTVSDINSCLTEFTIEYTKRKVADVLSQLALDKNLSRDSLMHYITDLAFDDLMPSMTTAKKLRKKVDTGDRCCALTSKGERCTRKRKGDSSGRYCGSHCNGQPHGDATVDDERLKPVIKIRKHDDSSEYSEYSEGLESPE